MTDKIGWVLLHRKIQEHWIWQDPNKFQWWVDMLLTVNNSKSKVALGNEVFECERGQSLLSIQSWASRWKVSKDTARNFLTLLEKDKMINRVNIGKSTRLTICNYDSYQQPLRVKQTAAVRTHYTNKEEDNENNLKDVESQRKLREDNFKKTFSKFVITEKNPTGKYELETAKAFFNHWSEWDDMKNKMKWEKQDTWEVSKRLVTWAKKEKEFSPVKKSTSKNIIDESENQNLY